MMEMYGITMDAVAHVSLKLDIIANRVYGQIAQYVIGVMNNVMDGQLNDPSACISC